LAVSGEGRCCESVTWMERVLRGVELVSKSQSTETQETDNAGAGAGGSDGNDNCVESRAQRTGTRQRCVT
jgi:hypothetical protein